MKTKIGTKNKWILFYLSLVIFQWQIAHRALVHSYFRLIRTPTEQRTRAHIALIFLGILAMRASLVIVWLWLYCIYTLGTGKRAREHIS